MKKKIKKDERGSSILEGAMLYEYSAKPKSKRSNQSNIKDKANSRLFLLMRKGSKIDRLAKNDFIEITEQEKKVMEFNRKMSECSKTAQYIYYNGILNDLKLELNKLENCGNKIKINIIKPSILIQIEDKERIVNELKIDINFEKKIT